MPNDQGLPWTAGTATGIGSLPYDDPIEATRIVLGELPDLPHLPELPSRGPGADMIGRTCGLLVELGVDLQPAGWRLTAAEGLDQRRSRSILARDLDALEELALGYTGPLKVQVTGPWTLAASVERPRGGRVLGDPGARRDVAQSLAEGLAAHLEGVRRRVPGAALVVQLDEPSLPSVLRGAVPTASGFSRYRTVEEPEAVELLRTVIGRVAADGALPVVHCCAAGVPFGMVARTGSRGLSFDLRTVTEADLEPLAEAVEDGVALFVGAVPSLRPEAPATRNTARGPNDVEIARTVLSFWRRLGFSEDSAALGCVVTPSCGLAGADPAWARTALTLARKAGAHLAERPT
ncbi:methionine synthase [Actinopolymorpha alba]|uniref:methionine synthase n=1 Tax=Actinopolymorpha alba TaxID=533267 RepID=UPI00036CA47C|nr:methionine synthase [Actinopolymorpha alba]